jgi:uncharacterized protein YifE (UPF0438 family)
MAATKQTLCTRIFSDFKNYPKGFQRSGDFSIKESQALEQFGHYIMALESGEIDAQDEEDHHIIAVLRGEEEPNTLATKAWKKYIARINRPKLGSIYGRKLNTDGIDDLDSDADSVLDDDLSSSPTELNAE